MNPTPPDEGAVTTAQPANEAGTQPGDMVISQDIGGTPIMVPAESVQATPEPEQPSEPAAEEVATPEKEQVTEPAQAESTDSDEEVIEWSKKKGITIDPSNPEMVKLARVNLENDRRFHESQQAKRTIQPPELLPESEDETYNQVISRQNETDLKMYVRDWFDANPDAKGYREDLAKVAAQYSYIPDMDVIHRIYLADPSREDKLRQEGGKRALQNLAQKQSNIPPAAAATNQGDYSSAKITSQNVDQMVSSMTPEEYKKRLPEINAALQG